MAEKLLNREQVDAVVQFAEGLAFYDQYGFWSPFLSNQYLQNLNNGGKEATISGVRKALADYKNNAENLQSYMDYMKFFDMIFSRTVESYVNALSFDLQVICANAYSPSDYQSSEYIRDKKIVNDFLNKFNYKSEFRKVVQQLMLREVYYTWFRKVKWGNKGMKYALQILPQDRCILTGYWEKGLLFDFDMSYFLQAGTDINGYDPAFKKYYNKVFGSEINSIENYRPTNPFNKRDGTYAMWTQTSPNDGGWAFKFDTSNFNAVPFLAPLLKSAVLDDEIQQLQENKDIAEAYAILAGEIATFDTAKSGTQADQMVFNPKTLGSFMSKAKQGIGSAVKLAALPVENLKWYQYEDKNTDMYEDQLRTTAGAGGVSRIIYSSDRMSNSEIEAALNEIYQTMKPLYYQFGNFMEFFVNQMTKKYKFRFVFDGSTHSYERRLRFDNLTKIADKGIVLAPSAWASVMGIEPQLFEASLLESKFGGWQDSLSLLLNTNTTSQSDRESIDIPNDTTDSNNDQ